ncbi:DELTA-alicitoxin-Pse2b-like [Oculina patagonica]
MYVRLLVLFTCLAITFRGFCKATVIDPSAPSAPSASDQSGTTELGKAIYLRGTNLLGDFQERETAIFEPFPSECFNRVDKNFKSSSSHFEHYANTKAFYSTVGTQSGLDPSLQSSYTLSATLKVATKSNSSEISKVSGTSLIVMALKEKIMVKRGCLDGDETSTLKKRFVEDLERLPVKIENPWQRNSWKPYRTFLKEYGSHVVTSVTLGTSLKQMTFAESSKAYTERDFQVKSCAEFAGPVAFGNLDVSACSDVSKEELSNASKMSTNNHLIIRGGSKETRNRLLHERSKELIEQLMNEATDSASSVQHTFRAIWDILQSIFEVGSLNHIRAVNLEQYYLGFLNYGCSYITSGGVDIQKFDHTKGSNEMYPEYECSLAKEGCHSDKDCHFRTMWCSCRGESCVRYKSVEQDTGVSKQTAYANTHANWAWKGCSWTVHGLHCVCKNKNRESRNVVWSLPSRDLVVQDAPHHGANHKAKDSAPVEPKKNKRKM